ncbi:MAG: hypothetical protein R2911_11320 [Caldilineaceae bacterium]
MFINQFLTRTLLGAVAGATLLLSGCQPVQPASAPAAAVAEAPSLHQLSVTANGTGYEAPAEAAAGWTTISLANQSDEMRQASLLRFAEGKTLDDLMALMQSGDVAGIPEWLIPVGGPVGVLPGMNGAVALNLTAGDYIMLDAAPDAGGVPGFAKGYLAPLHVTASTAATAEPVADLTVTLADYAFVFEEASMAAGRHTIRLENSGPQEPHEIAIVKLAQGATLQDFMAAISGEGPVGPPPGMSIGGSGPIAISEAAYVDVELEAGATYGLVCFLPSAHNHGQPHFMLGMMREFTVQ